jgi:cytochrome c551/c552
MNLKRPRLLVALAYVALSSISIAPQASEDMVEKATSSGCFICHSVAPKPGVAKPLAPSYQDVAARYRGDSAAFGTLVERVLHGSVHKEQNWEGKLSMRFMPPNVNITRTESIDLVRWILSLEGDSPISDELKKHESMMALATTSSCTTCHNISPLKNVRAVPLAPSFREIAAYYDGKEGARKHVLQSVRNGTMDKPKTWENVNMRFMPPNIAVRKQDAENLVDWILGLDHKGVKVPNMAAK